METTETFALILNLRVRFEQMENAERPALNTARQQLKFIPKDAFGRDCWSERNSL